MKNLTWVLSEKVLSMIFGLLVMAVIARLWGGEIIGRIEIAVAICTVFRFITDLGHQNFIIKDVIENNKSNVVIGTSLLAQVVMSSVFVLTVFWVVSVFYDDSTYLFFFAVCVSVIIERLFVFNFWLHSQSKFKDMFFISIISKLCGFAFVASCYAFLSLVDVVVFYIVVQVFIVGFGSYLVYRLRGDDALIFDKGYLLELSKKSWPFMLSSAICILYMKMDVIMIERFMNVESAGQYAVAAKLVIPFVFLGHVLSNAFYPSLIACYREDFIRYRKIGYKIVFISLLIAAVVVIFINLCSELILLYIFGENFVEMSAVLEVLSFSLFFLIPSAFLTKRLVIENKERVELEKTGAALLVNLVLNAILIPLYGVIGAAVATVFAYFVSDFIYYSIKKETRNIFIDYLCSYRAIKWYK